MGAGRVLSGMAAGLLMISSVVAAETITYTYDAKGRLVKVKRTGTANNNVTVDYEHDKANKDRKSVVSEKSVSVREDLGGRSLIKKKQRQTRNERQRNTEN